MNIKKKQKAGYLKIENKSYEISSDLWQKDNYAINGKNVDVITMFVCNFI